MSLRDLGADEYTRHHHYPQTAESSKENSPLPASEELVAEANARSGHQSMQSTSPSVSNSTHLSDFVVTPPVDVIQADTSSSPGLGLVREYKNNIRRPTTSSSGASTSAVPFQKAASAVPRRAAHNQSVYSRDSFSNPPPRSLRNSWHIGPSLVHSQALSDLTPSSARPGLKSARKPAVRRLKSTAILDTDTNPIEKPWLRDSDPRKRISYLLTMSCMLLGAVAGAALCFFGARGIMFVGDVCLVMDEDFSSGLNTTRWAREVSMGGFGNGEFEMTTASSNNSYVEDGVLYIVPTLTSDVIGENAIFNGYTYNITGCTTANATACDAVSNLTLQTVINPVQSARLTTVNSTSIKYGRVEVVARLPIGDWLWPAIWMLPVNNTYGDWPMSGEIDIMEARGNAPSYPKQGRNYVRSSLNWGPTTFINSVAKTFGWWRERHSQYSDKFNTYTLEWNEKFIRMYVNDRNTPMLQLKFNKPFFERGNYPKTVVNGTTEIVLENPWQDAGDNAAPFDQAFYLILDVAVGGTQGWFPDGFGDKPWLDGSGVAMYDFARAQETWYSTWPSDPKRRGMAISSVKMWQTC
ncbi:hypothetical protein M0805_004162 [Coniferiporia weirii]|nr:hypothetical protein M0805_004162 [Coniferiporia weirii]